MPNRSSVSSADARYKFTGKERDIETGYDYFACPPKSEGRRRGARYYDSRIGRWLSVDPLADLYPGDSPYSYSLNNPLKFINPTGMAAAAANPEDEEKNEKNERKVDVLDVAAQAITEFGQEVSAIFTDITDGITNVANDAYSLVYEQGPEYLNEQSDIISTGGYVAGLAISAAGLSEFGGPLVAFTATASTVLDVTATILTGVDYLKNGGSDRLNNLYLQSFRTSVNISSGHMAKKIEGVIKNIDRSVFDILEPHIPTEMKVGF